MALKGNYVATSYANEGAANTALGGDRGTGSLYYDSTASKLKVWTGSAWSAIEVPDLPEAVNNVGGLRLAWDFNKTACYDGTTHPANSVHSDFRAVMNIAPDSPNNTATNGGWIVDPRFIVADSDTTRSGSWDGDNSLTQDRKVFRPPASTGVHGNSGKFSPFDTTNGSHTTSSSIYGTELIHNMGGVDEDGTADQEIAPFYFDNTGTAQDDNDDVATWVVFKRFHKWSGATTGINNAGLISWRRQPAIRYAVPKWDYEKLKSHTVSCAFSTYDNGANNYRITQAMPKASWAYSTGSNGSTSDLTSSPSDGTYFRTAASGNPVWDGYQTFTSTNEHWQENFNMYTYEHNHETDECINFYFNDDASPTAGIGEDWGHASNDYAVIIASRSDGTDHWAYGDAEAYKWSTFGGGRHTDGDYSEQREWPDRTDSDFLYKTSYPADIQPYPADIAVVLYFNKALTASDREAIYDAYKGQFGLPD